LATLPRSLIDCVCQANSGGKFRRADEVEQRMPRISGRKHDSRRKISSPVARRTPVAALPVDDDLLHAGRCASFAAACLEPRGQRLGDPSDAARHWAMREPAAIEPVVHQRVTVPADIEPSVTPWIASAETGAAQRFPIRTSYR
jgi:hypothetical protein